MAVAVSTDNCLLDLELWERASRGNPGTGGVKKECSLRDPGGRREGVTEKTLP